MVGKTRRPARVLVINPNTSASLTKSFEPVLASLSLPDTMLTYWTCPTGPSLIKTQADMYESASHCIPLLRAMADDFDGFLGACYADHPVVRLLQSYVGSKPVVGIFDASILAALQLVGPSTRFGIVTTGVAYETLLSEGVRHLLRRDKEVLAKFGGVAASGVALVDLQPGSEAGAREKIMDATCRLLTTKEGEDNIEVVSMGGVILTGMERWVHEASELALGVEAGRRIKVIDQLLAGMLTLDALLQGKSIRSVDYSQVLSSLHLEAAAGKKGGALECPPPMDVSRSRDQRPCDNCRRRKIRCLFASSEAINCVLCESRSTVCTYVQSAPRKKRPLSSNDDTPPGGQTGSRPKQRLRPGSKDDTVVKDYASLKGQSLLKETLGHQNRQSSAIIGATTDFDPSLTHALSWNAKGECPSFQAQHILRRANQNVHFVMRPDTQDEMDAELTNLDAIEDFVSPHGPELVNLYFRIVHPSFPILHKKVFLEKYGRSYRELTPTGLGAVYIMALNWWSYSPALSSMSKPDAHVLESKVLKMLFEVHKRPKISDLQGGLVLMQSPNVSSWALAGHLIAMAQNLGMNFDCSDWQVPDWERGVRKRVAWALFMQDKWGALVYGRGSLLRADDWDVQPLTASDFPETSKDDDLEEGSAEIEKGKQTFLHMVSLTEIVADILDQFFTLRATRRRQTIEQVLESAKPLQLRLKAWLTALPIDLSVGDTVPRKLSSVGYLHLAYYTAEITLHRAILRSHSMASPAPDLYAITRLAASTRFTSALDFVKRLKAEHLQSFWYFSSGLSLAIIGLFAGILCMTSQDREGAEREALLAKLAEYRWLLRINSTSAEFMKYSIGVLDTRSQLMEQQIPLQAVLHAAQSVRSASQLDPVEYGDGDDDSPFTDDLLLSPNDGDEVWQQQKQQQQQQQQQQPPPNAFEQHYYGFEASGLVDATLSSSETHQFWIDGDG
ncbi:hypothetical protein BN1708_005497 [Verticillium longisporum]|uniref:Zn(2)-C6 fungal-type domain-containing protein n=1 Tax=Verticillium longisporum TaxID=100787 RepID=A0A0G4MCL8_VERLO|nr:hypothetical protein BN1708_005497 [Verticillium longisporum]